VKGKREKKKKKKQASVSDTDSQCLPREKKQDEEDKKVEAHRLRKGGKKMRMLSAQCAALLV
jgi:ribosomal protein S8E